MRTLVLLIAIGYIVAGVAAGECAVPSQRVQCGRDTCNATTHECEPCTASDQCWESSLVCRDGECVVDTIADNFDVASGFAIALAILVCSIAAVAGVGGGGILVPMYAIMLGLPLKQAVGLSQATITGQALVNVAFALSRHHPKYQPPEPTRPVINYVLLTFWLPIGLAGTTVGGLIGRTVPDWFRLVALFLLLSYVLYRVILRLRAQRAADAAAAKEKEPDGPEEPARIVYEHVQGDDAPPSPERPLYTETPEQPQQPGSLQLPEGGYPTDPAEDKVGPAFPQYPVKHYLLIAATFVPLFVLSLLRSSTLNIVDCGSFAFWGIVVVTVVYNFGMTGAIRVHLTRKMEAIREGTMSSEEVPFVWNHLTSIVFPLLTVTAGGAASLLGIGGGLILSFLLLEAGLAPEEASATSGLATFLVAGASLLQFIINKNVPLDYGGVFFIAGIISSFVGQFLFVRPIRANGWRFLIIGALAFIMGGSMLCLAGVGIYNTVELVEHDGSLGFGALCRGT